MIPIVLDFESFYSTEYSLTRLTVEEYVRDERFKVHLLAYKTKGSPAGFQYGDHLEQMIKSQAWSNIGAIAHNAAFDGFILSQRYGVKPAFWFDTLSMARLLFPHERKHSLGALCERLGLGKKPDKYDFMRGKRDPTETELQQFGEQGLGDVELTWKLFALMKPHVPAEELRLIDLTIRLMTEPVVELDTALLAAHHREIVENKDRLLKEIGATKEMLSSAEKYADLLRGLGIDPPTKLNKDGEEIYAFAKTDAAHVELLDHYDQRVQSIVAARLGIKSTGDEARCERLFHTGRRGLAPVPLRYAGAHTTRWSGDGKVNWQNFRRGSPIRKSVVAPKGYRIVVGDLSQVECRFVNWLAGEEDTIQLFRDGKDVYCIRASDFYSRTITKADKNERWLFKTAELGCGFGMGGPKFKITVNGKAKEQGFAQIEDYQAEAAVKAYRASHKNVVKLWYFAGHDILPRLAVKDSNYDWGPLSCRGGYIYLPNGAPLDYTTIERNGRDFKQIRKGAPHKIYGGLLTENVVQAMARVVLAQAALKINPIYRIITLTHDEVVCLAPEREADDALKFVLETLRTEPAWAPGIPLDAEGSHGERYDK